MTKQQSVDMGMSG